MLNMSGASPIKPVRDQKYEKRTNLSSNDYSPSVLRQSFDIKKELMNVMAE